MKILQMNSLQTYNTKKYIILKQRKPNPMATDVSQQKEQQHDTIHMQNSSQWHQDFH